tara:strand:- start:2907 stop:3080 length:174 start_codon:yes stop_codon:yes gene_type:complete
VVIGYYSYQRRAGDKIDYYYQKPLEAVEDIAEATEGSYGSWRMKEALNWVVEECWTT